MEHKTWIKNYENDFERLAQEIGDLRYDSIADFLLLLSQKIEKDGGKDRARGRVKLANALDETAKHLKESSESVAEAWRICEPFMFPKELTFEQAKNIAKAYLDELYREIPIQIFEERILEFEFGWAFPYDGIGKRNILTGNGAMVIDKFTKEIWSCGTAEEPICYLNDYVELKTGKKNIWTARLAKKQGISRFFKTLKLSRDSLLYLEDIWRILNSFPECFAEGNIRKVVKLKNVFRLIGVEIILEKKDI